MINIPDHITKMIEIVILRRVIKGQNILIIVRTSMNQQNLIILKGSILEQIKDMRILNLAESTQSPLLLLAQNLHFPLQVPDPSAARPEKTKKTNMKIETKKSLTQKIAKPLKRRKFKSLFLEKIMEKALILKKTETDIENLKKALILKKTEKDIENLKKTDNIVTKANGFKNK